jgi:hypothetical protein
MLHTHEDSVLSDLRNDGVGDQRNDEVGDLRNDGVGDQRYDGPPTVILNLIQDLMRYAARSGGFRIKRPTE